MMYLEILKKTNLIVKCVSLISMCVIYAENDFVFMPKYGRIL